MLFFTRVLESNRGKQCRKFSWFLDWLTKSFDKWENDRTQMSAMMCWSIRRCRNDLVWNQRGREVTNVVESTRVALNQWKCARDKTFDNFLCYMIQADGDEQWRRPMENKIKINADTVIFEPSNYYSFSYMERDHMWEVLTGVNHIIYPRKMLKQWGFVRRSFG